MAHVATRRAPNCFNFLRQMEVLTKAGDAGSNFKATAVARAFNIGRAESTAVSHLIERISKPVVAELKEASRCRGMRQWLTHEVIAKEAFNTSWSSGTGAFAAWSVELTNDADDCLVKMFIERLKKDWDRLPPGLKKPWVFKDALQVHASCGGFITILETLRKNIPKADYDTAVTTLQEQFSLGYLDPDIVAFLENGVPPVQLAEVNFVRNIVTSVEQRKQNEMHEKERELAERVAAATVEQIRHKFNQDVDTLKARTQCRDELALEAAKDAKYLAQRQSNLSVFVMASLDCCVWPSNSAYLENCLQTFRSILAMSSQNAGHLQLPLAQQQTANTAVLKHRNRLQYFMLEAKLDPTMEVALIFDRSNVTTEKDKRKSTHPCHFVTAEAHTSNAWRSSAVPESGTIGPCPLIRCTDMFGYDPDCRPGPAARTEQFLGVPAHLQIVQNYLRGMAFGDKDVVVWVDILPNRYCEFGRAVLGRLLDSNAGRPPVFYYGCLRDDQKDVKEALEDLVYNFWDQSDAAPPKSRPVETVADPDLVLLSWSNGQPAFPEQLLSKFSEGSAGHKSIHDMQKELLTMFPNAQVQGSPGTGRGGNPRATGRPDYTIDGGGRPLDFTRALDKTITPKSSFSAERKVYVAAAKGKPSLVLDTNYALWVGNETDEETTFAPSEIAGFNLGTFEEKVVSGMGEKELSGIPFRFPSDLCLVCYEKKLMSLADFAHQICTVHGVADFELACHQISQKMYPVTRLQQVLSG
ncbi:unnamed protein product [Durusdinium trenchii]